MMAKKILVSSAYYLMIQMILSLSLHAEYNPIDTQQEVLLTNAADDTIDFQRLDFDQDNQEELHAAQQKSFLQRYGKYIAIAGISASLAVAGGGAWVYRDEIKNFFSATKPSANSQQSQTPAGAASPPAGTQNRGKNRNSQKAQAGAPPQTIVTALQKKTYTTKVGKNTIQHHFHPSLIDPAQFVDNNNNNDHATVLLKKKPENFEERKLPDGTPFLSGGIITENNEKKLIEFVLGKVDSRGVKVRTKDYGVLPKGFGSHFNAYIGSDQQGPYLWDVQKQYAVDLQGVKGKYYITHTPRGKQEIKIWLAGSKAPNYTANNVHVIKKRDSSGSNSLILHYIRLSGNNYQLLALPRLAEKSDPWSVYIVNDKFTPDNGSNNFSISYDDNSGFRYFFVTLKGGTSRYKIFLDRPSHTTLDQQRIFVNLHTRQLLDDLDNQRPMGWLLQSVKPVNQGQ